MAVAELSSQDGRIEPPDGDLPLAVLGRLRVERKASGDASSVMAMREQRLVAGRERLFG
jgi:hypothetical protein